MVTMVKMMMMMMMIVMIVMKTTKVLPSFVAQQMIRDIAMEEEKTHGDQWLIHNTIDDMINSQSSIHDKTSSKLR